MVLRTGQGGVGESGETDRVAPHVVALAKVSSYTTGYCLSIALFEIHPK